MYTIPDAFCITCRGNGQYCGIYAQLIVTNLHIGTKFCCGREGWCRYMRSGEDVIEVVGQFIVIINVLFLIIDLVGIFTLIRSVNRIQCNKRWYKFIISG